MARWTDSLLVPAAFLLDTPHPEVLYRTASRSTACTCVPCRVVRPLRPRATRGLSFRVMELTQRHLKLTRRKQKHARRLHRLAAAAQVFAGAQALRWAEAEVGAPALLPLRGEVHAPTSRRAGYRDSSVGLVSVSKLAGAREHRHAERLECCAHERVPTRRPRQVVLAAGMGAPNTARDLGFPEAGVAGATPAALHAAAGGAAVSMSLRFGGGRSECGSTATGGTTRQACKIPLIGAMVASYQAILRRNWCRRPRAGSGLPMDETGALQVRTYAVTRDDSDSHESWLRLRLRDRLP